MRTYRIIYEAIEDVEAAMKGMLEPEYKEVILGRVEIRATFKVPGVGNIGGLMCKKENNEKFKVRLLRDGIVIYDGQVSSLKDLKMM